MYFPQSPLQIREFLKNIDSYSGEDKIRIIEEILEQLKHLPPTIRRRAIFDVDFKYIKNWQRKNQCLKQNRRI